MAQIFHRLSNKISKAIGVLIIGAIVVSLGLLPFIYNSSLVTGRKIPLAQPVPFSHKQHAKGLGLDCRYCHTGVETSSFAGIPPIKTCMTCHTEVKKDSAVLEPIRQAYKTGQPLKWRRDHALPDYVYFNHSIHIAKGVGCVSCHGQVSEMEVVWKEHTLYMNWCLDCHRDPGKNLRPREAVYQATWNPAQDPHRKTGTDLVKEYHVKRKLDCTACHR